MSIVSTTEQRLKIAIYYNKVIDYLEGAGVYKINSDPRDVNSPHAFNFSIECYNKFAAKYPQFELDRRFSEEIISKLKSDECNVYDVYYLFNCLAAQLRLEKNGIASFVVEKSKLDDLINQMRYFKDFIKKLNRMDVISNQSQHQIKNGEMLLANKIYLINQMY